MKQNDLTSEAAKRNSPRSIALAVLIPSEGVLKVHKLARPAGHEVNTDYVEAHRGPLGQRQLPQVLVRQPAERVALVAVDGRFGRSHILGGARLDFDDTEKRSLPGDQVDVPGPVARSPAPSNDDVSLSAQEKQRGVLALKAGGEMLWRGGPAAAARESVQAGKRPLQYSVAQFGLSHGSTIVGGYGAKGKSQPYRGARRINGKRNLSQRASVLNPKRLMTMKRVWICWPAVGLTVMAGLAGCRVHVDKDADGKEKTVQVDTPFGGVHVNTDQVSASDLGLPVYPGAEPVRGDDKHKSADVHLGFGEWQLRVRAVTYATSDSEEKVTEFYKKALGRFGEVLTCEGKSPVGTPTITSEGLTCADDNKNVKVNDEDFGSHSDRLQLRAGSKRHQHIVGFESPRDGKTRFALVALDLPAGHNSD